MAEPEQLRRTRATSSVTAHRPVTGPAVVATFRAAITQHGTPFSTLTDNGMAFMTRFAQRGRTSRNALENEFVELRVRQKNSRPNHPTTCGKVERFQQTRKEWLRTHLADPPDHENQTDRTLTGVRSVSDVPRHHIRSFVRSWSWGESNPRPSANVPHVIRPFPTSRLTLSLTGGSASHRLPGDARDGFPSGHRSSPTPMVFPIAIFRFCCRAADERPRAPFLVTMSLHYLTRSGGESELLFGNSCCCPV